MYIHKSLDNPKFLSDRKLNLLRNHIITQGQFINLIELKDPYTIIGPAIIDKTKINEFIEEWKTQKDVLVPIQEAFVKTITQQDIIDHLNELTIIFPQINNLTKELQLKLKDSECPVCLKNKYILLILLKIRDLYKDGRNLGTEQQFIETVMHNYFPFTNKLVTNQNLQEFDLTWIKPDSLVALGQDLIIGLSNCFDCCKKHLSRAKALFEEWHQKYPTHGTLMYNQFTEANKDIEEGYIIFWDSLGQLDMASEQLVGSLYGLFQGYQINIINLANEIRKARILFQQNSNNVPNFDQLRIEVQKLQNKINSLNKDKKK